MSEIEPPTEHLHEHLHHAAQHGTDRWISWAALSSAIMAVIAAVAALMAGHHVDEAMIGRIMASDQWAYYQAKSVKSSVLKTKMETLAALGRKDAQDDQKKLETYASEMEAISEKAKELESESDRHLEHHSRLASAVTLFQVAIALGAIAALSRRAAFWYFSLVFGLVGSSFFIRSLMLR